MIYSFLMNYFYYGERDSWLEQQMEKDALLREPERRFRLLRLDRFTGTRRDRPVTSHAHWELTAVLAGTGELRTLHGSFPLQEDSIALIAPGEGHAESSSGQMTLIWLGFLADFRPSAVRQRVAVVQSAEVCRELETLWKTLVSVPNLSPTAIDGRFLLVLDALQRALSRENSSGSDTVNRIVSYLNRHWQEPLQIAELASEAGWSPGHLHRRFKAAVGVSPVEYLINLKIHQAGILLEESDLTVREIARNCGFQDPCYFSRLFRQRVGVSPAGYRSSRMLDRQQPFPGN